LTCFDLNVSTSNSGDRGTGNELSLSSSDVVAWSRRRVNGHALRQFALIADRKTLFSSTKGLDACLPEFALEVVFVLVSVVLGSR
jgi:hypothetical protein